MPSSSDVLTYASFAVGLLNLVFNMRLQLQAWQLRTWARRLLMGHLADYHGVKFTDPEGNVT